MSEKRVIKINEDMFKIPNKTRKAKQPSSEIKVKTPRKDTNNNTLKRKLLQIIRNKQNQKIKEHYDPRDEEIEDAFENEFSNSLEYLSNLVAKHPPAPKLNGTLKNHVPLHEHVNLELPSELLEHDITHSTSFDNNIPKYGCLKNGNLPTYRTWKNQTQKNYGPVINTTVPITNRITNPITNSVASPLTNFAASPITNSVASPITNFAASPITTEPPKPTFITSYKQTQNLLKPTDNCKKPKKHRKIVRRNYTIGRSKHKPILSVLVSNRTLRNKAATQQKLLQQTSIEDIKKHLVKRGFIKVGCIAPNDVLRQMYECTMMMCGDVKNHNPDYLLHNFLNQQEY